MKSLFEQFEVIEDPRDIRGKKHELLNILIMTIYGILVGLKDFENIGYFLKQKESYFIELLKLENGVPSHDTLSRVFSMIEPEKFMNIFISWIKEISTIKGKVISIDGKAIRNATDKINGGNIPYIVSAFLSEAEISIGQIKVEDKSNEITAIPELIDMLQIEGATITIDAIGTQEQIINKIVEKKGHYVLKVKENQKKLKKNIEKYFNTINVLKSHSEIFYMETKEKDHGRIESREYYLSYNIKTIEDKEKWKTVKSIGLVKTKRIIGDEMTITEDYYILDNNISIESFERITRSHWKIECSLHWRLDVIMGEDNSRNRIGNSIDNLSIIRKIVFNLASLDKSFGEKLPLQRKLTNYMLDFKNIENLIFNIIPIACQ